MNSKQVDRGDRTALVLAGGGSLGAVQIGMLQALVGRVQIHFVVGSSVGAINAAHFAMDPTPGGVTTLVQFWQQVRRRNVFPVSPLAGLLGLLGRCDYLASPAPLKALLTRAFGDRRLEHCRLPCHRVATDLLDGREVVLSSGPVVPALQSRISLKLVAWCRRSTADSGRPREPQEAAPWTVAPGRTIARPMVGRAIALVARSIRSCGSRRRSAA